MTKKKIIRNYALFDQVLLLSDMDLFGFCPSREEFTLALCEICNMLVKPQALKRHTGKTGHGIGTLSRNSLLEDDFCAHLSYEIVK